MSLKLDKISYTYEPGTPMEAAGLKEVSLEIFPGEFFGLIGHTGSGKSTLIQHMNGLLAPQSGTVSWKGEDIHAKGFDRRAFRGKVGLVFQYPEYQLFEEDVLSDVCFGPKNQGLDRREAEERARRALELVALPEEYYSHSPFELSGGQKRRAAIAGVLAMQPEILILDEPTAGLDPRGREELLDLLTRLKAQGMGIVTVSHSMEDMAARADRIGVMDRGELVMLGTPGEVFARRKELEAMGLAVPEVTRILGLLQERGFALPGKALDLNGAVQEILTEFRQIS